MFIFNFMPFTLFLLGKSPVQAEPIRNGIRGKKKSNTAARSNEVLKRLV